ncbi:hypothetical protein SAMN05444166_5407 [Singulisphaera sp. GP187]|uniref:hypothetical protein n=1 Tax=Singulisphaera sp. GP187 TaxID=1882752 RepID=UPI00092A6A20|nr:hypothetical protein [Singulisphaera sp. GP187]SIO57458.1 hypothetical protein SAMN05444166_5407 [Singulisphaera sp. GP187]
MLGAILILVGLLPLVPQPAVDPSEFQRWFEAASQGQLQIPTEVAREAAHFRYVFVAGFWNERMPAYFAQNAQELRTRGVPRDAIHFIYPSSHKSIEENADLVHARFLEIAEAGPEPLVVIAHSRGACDTLAFALENPEFVRTRIRALFLVQGPFGGTGVADYVAGDGPSLDPRIPLRYRAVANLLGRFEKIKLKRGKHGGLSGMTQQASEDFWEQMLEKHLCAIPVVGPKTFYVTSETTPEQQRLFKRATAWYLQTLSGPNDGVVALEDQSLPALGTVLAVLDAGHSDLTNRGPATRAPRQLRRALIQGVVMAVGSPGERARIDEHASRVSAPGNHLLQGQRTH